MPVVILFTTIFGMLSFYIAKEVIAGISKKADVDPVSLDLKKEQWLSSLQEVDTEGQSVTLKNIKAEYILVNFWASWCAPCLKEFPEMVKLREKIPAEKLYILGINCDMENTLKNFKKTKEEFKFNFPNVLDSKNKHLDAIGSTSLPATLVFKNGKLIYSNFRQTSFLAQEFLELFK